MGLFDTIYCEYPLPDAGHQDLDFQTKDLDCLMETYTISRDGRLLRHVRRRKEPDRDVEWPLHGDLRMYTSLPGDSPENRTWVEYVVRFTHSRVEWIKPREEVPAPPEIEPAEFDWDWLSELSKIAREREKPTPATPPDAPGAETEATPGSEEALLQSLRRERRELEALLERCNDHWGYEDPIYRFYHQSFKVYWLQDSTRSIVDKLQALVPERPLNPWFVQIVESGTGKTFSLEDKARWLEVTRPILEAFFHARYFLEMAVRYADLTAPPQPLPSGYAALLYLFGLR